MFYWSCLPSLVLLFTVSPVKANEWKADVPSSVLGLSGSCVVIPCKFFYPAGGKTYTSFTGIWYTADPKSTVYHTDASQISDKYRSRTTLTGDLHKNDCSLKISSLKDSDAGSYMFRIEIKNLDKNTYGHHKVSLTVQATPETPIVTVQEEVTSGKPVTATCAVLYSCPSELPHIIWNHEGTNSNPSNPQNSGLWKLTYYTLTFTASREDHNRRLSCSANFNGKIKTNYKTLQVKYPPYVTVSMKPSVKENETIRLTCSSDSNPPADRFQWFSSSGTRLGSRQTLSAKVSRHTEAIYCTAQNTEGKNSSGPQKINVLYPPYNVTVVSNSPLKENESAVLTCSSDSNPPADRFQWFSFNGTLLEDKLNYTLEKVSRHSEAISCTAQNTQGKNSSGPQKINVLYPPYNVTVVSNSPLKENESAVLTCSSDSNPPADRFQWFSFNGTLLEDKLNYTLEKVSRHSEAISCTAQNAQGKNSSGPQTLNILYPPEIKSESSCTFLGYTVCVCTVDSNPPSEVEWFGPDSLKTFSSSSTEQNGSLTIATLQSWLVFSKTVQCSAKNSLGSSFITLEVPQIGTIIYGVVASTVVVILFAIIVFAMRRHCGNGTNLQNSALQADSLNMKTEQNELKTKQNSNTYEEGYDEDIYSNCLDSSAYNNWECYSEALPSDSSVEDEPIYSNM